MSWISILLSNHFNINFVRQVLYRYCKIYFHNRDKLFSRISETFSGENLWLDLDIVEKLLSGCRCLFPSTGYAFASMPTYAGGHIGFLMASLNPVSYYHLLVDQSKMSCIWLVVSLHRPFYGPMMRCWFWTCHSTVLNYILDAYSLLWLNTGSFVWLFKLKHRIWLSLVYIEEFYQQLNAKIRFSILLKSCCESVIEEEIFNNGINFSLQWLLLWFLTSAQTNSGIEEAVEKMPLSLGFEPTTLWSVVQPYCPKTVIPKYYISV